MVDVIVVSGNTGTGKTELSRRLSRMIGFRCKNVGDMLSKFVPFESDRRQIGTEFLSRYGIKEYCDLLLTAAAEPTILDGVRLYAGLSALRASTQDVLHIHRSDEQRSADLFSQDTTQFELTADIRVPWMPQIAQLDEFIATQIVPKCGN